MLFEGPLACAATVRVIVLGKDGRANPALPYKGAGTREVVGLRLIGELGESFGRKMPAGTPRNSNRGKPALGAEGAQEFL